MNEQELDQKAKELKDRLTKEAEAAGYHINPDVEIVMDLCRGLVRNLERYGYMCCPCRLAAGKKEADLDLICPCDYRDADLAEYGACYCALYVNTAISKGEARATSIPERRPPQAEREKRTPAAQSRGGLTVFRCRVCGYLCAREGPPEICPICKAKKERFEPFVFS